MSQQHGDETAEPRSSGVNPPWAMRLSVVLLGGACLLLLAAVVVAGVGTAWGFDAAPVAGVLAVVAVGAVIAFSVAAEVWGWWRPHRVLRGEDSGLDEIPLTDVPERAAMRDRDRRVLLRRLEAQRAARNQRAASGGSVSSTDAGRPSQGSSEATTEP